jgi:hypothetical protein
MPKTRFATIGLLSAAAFSLAPLDAAQAHGHEFGHGHHFGHGGGPVGAVVGLAAAIVTAPFALIAAAAEAGTQPAYYPAPNYAAPPVYYAPPAPVIYAPPAYYPPAYPSTYAPAYAPPPAYYRPPPVYYPPPPPPPAYYPAPPGY